MGKYNWGLDNNPTHSQQMKQNRLIQQQNNLMSQQNWALKDQVREEQKQTNLMQTQAMYNNGSLSDAEYNYLISSGVSPTQFKEKQAKAQKRAREQQWRKDHPLKPQSKTKLIILTVIGAVVTLIGGIIHGVAVIGIIILVITYALFVHHGSMRFDPDTGEDVRNPLFTKAGEKKRGDVILSMEEMSFEELYKINCFSKNKEEQISAAQLLEWRYGFEINCPEIDESVLFAHHARGCTVVAAKICEHVVIFQNVTIGSNQRYNKKTQQWENLGTPIISKGVVIADGAKVLGPIVIGENTVIGAGAIVTKDIPANSVVYGVNKFKPKDPDYELVFAHPMPTPAEMISANESRIKTFDENG
jgi:serine O-acetyltransferase